MELLFDMNFLLKPSQCFSKVSVGFFFVDRKFKMIGGHCLTLNHVVSVEKQMDQFII